MAVSKFMRVFFGQLQLDATAYATIPYLDDSGFTDFLTGIEVGGSGFLHTRVPAGVSGSVLDWDEYIDLKTARVNTVRPEDMTLYKDLSGIEYVQRWVTAAQYDSLPTNSISVEAEIAEWFYPTQRLSMPLVESPIRPLIAPNPNGQTTLPAVGQYLWPLLDTATTGIMRMYFRFARDLGGGSYEYSDPTIVDAPYNSAAPAQYSAWYLSNLNAFDVYLVAYRTEIERNNLGEAVIQDFPKLLAGYAPTGIYSQLIPANAALHMRRLEHLFDDTLGALLDRPALNDSRARLNFDYEHRGRIDIVTGFPQQMMLILNTEKYKYYKGVLLSISPFFSTGVGKRTEDTAVFQMQVYEEGVFTDASLLDPSVGLTAKTDKTLLPT